MISKLLEVLISISIFVGLLLFGRWMFSRESLYQQITRVSQDTVQTVHTTQTVLYTTVENADYELDGLAAQHKEKYKEIDTISLPCPPGCEYNGNCNAALGRCECAVGYTGPSCNISLWPSCRVHPTASAEVFCGTWFPKSCSCLRECARFICPKGPTSCERGYDAAIAKCFERPANATLEIDGVQWDGGSDLPESTEPGLKYYRGAFQQSGSSYQIDRHSLVDLNPGRADGFTALPIRACPQRCHYNGACMQQKQQQRPFCKCHYGFTGASCGEIDLDKGRQHTCWNNCKDRGVCRRGFCHCHKGFWGKDCSRSVAYAAHSAKRVVHKLKLYAYDLPWELAYQPEYHLGWRDHDQIYMAWKVFGEMFFNDEVVRTDNPWEANMFYIPAMTYAYSVNLGDTVTHSRRVINYIRQTWPFFNRTKGLDHFIWLTNDRGACFWPGEEEPVLANVMKVVHFGWHYPQQPMPKGWVQPLPNKLWGCFNPLRDIVAAPYWYRQGETAIGTYGVNGRGGTFNLDEIPDKKLLFFAGAIRHNEPEYSQGVRQELHKLFGNDSHPDMTISEGGRADYHDMIRGSKFCLAPSGHGWGIRLSQYMALGCVPVIIQDDIYQPWEDQLPYHEFSVRIPRTRIPAIAELLQAITDEEYLQLRAGMVKFWPAFVWDQASGGKAYDYMIKALTARMVALNARHYHALQQQQQQPQQQEDMQLAASSSRRAAGND